MRFWGSLAAFGPIEQISNWIERYLSNRISNRISCEVDFQGQILFKMANQNFIPSLEFLYTLLSLHAKRLNVMFMNKWMNEWMNESLFAMENNTRKKFNE